MKSKVFTGTGRLPCGIADADITDGCLVLEGGGFRGLYVAGVLDALMEVGLNFSCVVGVSAGALFGMNYLSGQIGRGARINLNYRHDDNYVGFKAIKEENGIIGLDYLFNELNKTEPFDSKRFFESEQRFVAVATNCITGETEYFEKNKCSDIFAAIKASSSLPYMSKIITIDNIPYLDGGCSCRIPFDWAIKEEYKKIIVVKTRHREYHKDNNRWSPYYPYLPYNAYPKLVSTLNNMEEKYKQDCERLEQLEKQNRLFVIAPSKELNTGALEGDLNELERIYFLGYNDLKNQLSSLKEYVEIQ